MLTSLLSWTCNISDFFNGQRRRGSVCDVSADVGEVTGLVTFESVWKVDDVGIT